MNWFKTATAAVGAALGWLYGPMTTPLIVLITAAAIDYVTGVLRAYSEKMLSSSTGFAGLLKKVGMLAAVAVAALADKILPADTAIFQTAVTLFYAANEMLSIVENTAALGLPWPKLLTEALRQLKEKNE